MNEAMRDWLCRASEAKRLALIAHVSPDGDTVGGALALRLAFLSLGKEADVICDGDVPGNVSYLEGIDAIIQPGEAAGHYDTAIAVDISSEDRMGLAKPLFDAADARLVVDHHATNTRFGDVNLVRPGESATCLLVYELIREMGVPLTPELATCLMTGMSTDTGHFQYQSTSPETFEAAAELLRAGVDLSLMTRRLYRTKSLARVRLTQVAYQKMRFVLNGQVGVIALTRDDFDETKTTPDEADGLVNQALEVEGVRVAVLASERDDGVRMSLRAVEPDRVDQIAVTFGGGGHALAAGCLLQGTVEEAVAQVIDEISKRLGA